MGRGSRTATSAAGNGALPRAEPWERGYDWSPQVGDAVRLNLTDARNPPLETFILGNALPLAKSSALFGPSGVGKTALAAQLAFAFAAGAETLWGLRLLSGGGPALVYSAEDSLDDWKRKAAAVERSGLDLERALQRLFIIDKSEGVARLSEVVTELRPGFSRCVAQPTEEQQRLVGMARAVGARLVLVETASRLVEDEDNANMSALQSALGSVARETGAAVVATHHPTKQAAKENDSDPLSARGGGAFVANARNVLSLFPASPEGAVAYSDRFPVADLFVLAHGKSTSSTRPHAPITLVRCDGKWGAYFARPEDVSLSPEQEAQIAERVAADRAREWDPLRRLYEVVEGALPARPSISPSWLRDHCARDLGVAKHRVEPLVRQALDRGVLKIRARTERGITLGLGNDPRTPIRANADESPEVTP